MNLLEDDQRQYRAVVGDVLYDSLKMCNNRVQWSDGLRDIV